MRKLVWFTLGFAAACGLCAYLPIDPAILPCAIGFFLLGIGLFFLKKEHLRIPIALMVGLGIGFGWYYGFFLIRISPTRKYDGQTLQTSVLVTDYSRTYSYAMGAEGKITLDDRQYSVYFYGYGDTELKPGDRVEGSLKLRVTTTGDKDSSSYHQGNGIFLIGSFEEEMTVIPASQVPQKYWAQEFRYKILQNLERVFPEDTEAFARALLLGDTTKLSYRQDSAFQISGIRHVIAVSGLHVSILCALVYTLTARKRLFTVLLGIPILFMFAAIAGFTPSVVRACVMQGLMMLAMLLGKDYDPPTSLASAVLILLAVNPLTITAVSFQLSVGCMIGIFLFSRPIYDAILGGRLSKYAKKKGFLGNVLRWIGVSVSMTFSSMALTTPLCAYYFGMVSIVGVFTNLLTLWIVSFIFYGIMLACVLGSFWYAGGCFVAALISWPMRFVQWVAALFSKIPMAAVYTESGYIVAWLVFAYLMLLVFVLLKKKQPAVLVACLLCGLFASVGVSWLDTRICDYTATVIDVGQGQSILLRSDEETYLVDCGGNNPVKTANHVAELLLSRGIYHLDGVIVTHYDSDHVNAVDNLLNRIPVDTLYLPDVEDEKGYRKELTKHYEEKIFWVNETVTYQDTDHCLSIFPGIPGETGNESSLCILFQRENCDILITGDRGRRGEDYLREQTQLPKLELLIAGHHGSDSSTGIGLVAATQPETVIISVGGSNAYYLPSNKTLGLLEMFDCRVYRTDLQGTIDYRG